MARRVRVGSKLGLRDFSLLGQHLIISSTFFNIFAMNLVHRDAGGLCFAVICS